MNFSLNHFLKKRQSVIVWGLFIFCITFALNLFDQYKRFNQQKTIETQQLKALLQTDFYKIQEQLKTTYALIQKTAHPKMVLETVSQTGAQSLIGIGTAQKVEADMLESFEARMQQKGFESFKVKDRLPNQKQHIINNIYPYSADTQQYLGTNLSLSESFNAKLAMQTSQAQVQTLAIESNSPRVLLFWSNLASLSNTTTAENHPEQVVFYILDMQKKLTSALLPEKTALTVDAYDFTMNGGEKTFGHSSPEKAEKFLTEHAFELDYAGTKIQVRLQVPFSSADMSFNDAFTTALAVTFLFSLLYFLVFSLQDYIHGLQSQQSRQKQFLSNAHEAIIITDNTGIIRDWNPQALNLFGYRKTEAIDQSISKLLFASIQNETNLYLSNIEQLPTDRTFTTDLMNRDRQRVECQISVSKLEVNNQSEVVFFIADISERKRNEQEIRQLAYFDPLTGLENRTYFSQKVESVLQQNHSVQSALLFIDLDGFKRINDTLGHSIGDELLKIVAQRFKHSTRSNERHSHLCRFGGDEFIFYLHDIQTEGAIQTTNRILKQVEKTIHIGSHEIQISGSVGVAFYPQHGEDLDTLLRHADTAMYRAKASGKNTFMLYQSEMEEQLSQGLLIEKHLRTAIANDEFELFYQPQIEAKTQTVVGVEALIRWQSKELGFIPPDQFIQVAEETGQIIQIGHWVAHRAIKQLKAWQNTPFAHTRIAINVSAQQIQEENFAENVSQWLKTEGISPDLLELELTERTVMTNAQENIERFGSIRSQGLSLSVDDFGTGYSSLSYLKRFPLNILKVDKSFVDGLPGDDDDVSISTSIIQLAHSLHMKVVAEGVETEEQLKFLTELGCDMIQGYYYSKPLPVKEFEAWLLSHQELLAQDSPQ